MPMPHKTVVLCEPRPGKYFTLKRAKKRIRKQLKEQVCSSLKKKNGRMRMGAKTDGFFHHQIHYYRSHTAHRHTHTHLLLD